MLRCVLRLALDQTLLTQSCRHLKSGGSSVGLGKKGKPGKTAGVMQKREMPVESDPKKLATYCCGTNVFKEGEDVMLKPRAEYPDWLWKIPTGPPPKLEDLDPNTLEYWELLKARDRRRKNKIIKVTRLKNP
ncbi:unnamed protein product [Notodromas monacha]|uniref:Large ribosomal subunit protein mL54 n=1 Tax=Notodromas monacha TaxID=399045 RepID=A0A7R9GE31_9CRUS|nr:unnamed protein product [Notodromas monacha]CAG0917467.1 unnamed protein product [Notodromas monacha]